MFSQGYKTGFVVAAAVVDVFIVDAAVIYMNYEQRKNLSRSKSRNPNFHCLINFTVDVFPPIPQN